MGILRFKVRRSSIGSPNLLTRPSSVLEQPDWFQNGVCYGPRLGYDVPPDITNLVGISPSLVNAIENALSVILVLHPVACGLLFIGFILAIFLGPHSIAIGTLIVSIVTGILTALVFAVDLALVLVARKEITDITTFHFRVDFGAGFWMMLVSLIATWIAVVLLSARACYCCGVRP